VPPRRCPENRSVEQFHEVAESLSTRIVVDPDPSASIGLVGLFQGQRNVAKRTPGCRIEKICFGGFEGTGSDFHRRVFAVHSSECRHLFEGYESSVISSRISPRIPLRMRYALLPVAFRRRVDHHPTDQAPLAGGAPSRLPFRGRTGLGWPAAGGRLVVRAAAVIEPPRRCATARGVASEAQAAPSGLMRREFSLHVAERNSFLFQADPRSDPVKLKILE
jgi:hypothetical protein